MKYEVGDIVTVREDLSGYRSYKMSEDTEDEALCVTGEMRDLRGRNVQIYQAIDEIYVDDDCNDWHRGYRIITPDGEIMSSCIWTDDMFSALVEKHLDDIPEAEDLSALYEWA